MDQEGNIHKIPDTPKKRIAVGFGVAASLLAGGYHSGSVDAQLTDVLLHSGAITDSVSRQEQQRLSFLRELPVGVLAESEQTVIEGLIQNRHFGEVLFGNVEVFEFSGEFNEQTGRYTPITETNFVAEGSFLDTQLQLVAREMETLGVPFSLHAAVLPLMSQDDSIVYHIAVTAKVQQPIDFNGKEYTAGSVFFIDSAGKPQGVSPSDGLEIGYAALDRQAQEDVASTLGLAVPSNRDFTIIPVGMNPTQDQIMELYSNDLVVPVEPAVVENAGTQPVNIRMLPLVLGGLPPIGTIPPGSTIEQASLEDYLAYLATPNGESALNSFTVHINLEKQEGETDVEAITRYLELQRYNTDTLTWKLVRWERGRNVVDGTLEYQYGFNANVGGISERGGIGTEGVLNGETAKAIQENNESIDYSQEPVIMVNRGGGMAVTDWAKNAGVSVDSLLPQPPNIAIPETISYRGREYPTGYVTTVELAASETDSGTVEKFMAFIGIVENRGSYTTEDGIEVEISTILIPSTTDPQRPTRIVAGGANMEGSILSYEIAFHEGGIEELLQNLPDELRPLSNFAEISQDVSNSDYFATIGNLHIGDPVLLFFLRDSNSEEVLDQIKEGTVPVLDNFQVWDGTPQLPNINDSKIFTDPPIVSLAS